MQAFLITAYKNLEHLYDLATLFDEQAVVYIHLDRKTHVPKDYLLQLKNLPQVKLVSQKYKVFWGGFSHLKAILHLSEEALLNSDITRFHLISGHDYPIKPIKEFELFFNKNNSKNYILHYPLPIKQWPSGGIDRYRYFNFYDLLDAKKYRHYIFKAIEIQKKLGVKRSMTFNGLKLYGGDSWWSLNRDALLYVLNFTKKNPRYFKRHKYTFCSEEIYFQTILANSKLAKTLDNDSLRYIDWSDRNGNFPANLDATDVNHLKSSNAFFARKFEFPVSLDLKRQLLKEILND